MKEKCKNLLLFSVLFFIFLLNVNAEAGYTGSGSTSYFGGGSSGGSCTGRYCLQASNILKFTLIHKNNDDKVEIVTTGGNGFYMINEGSSYSKKFNDSKINAVYTSGPGIYGEFLSTGNYSQDPYVFNKIPDGISFSRSVIDSIIPKSKGGLNFSNTNLKSSIMKNATEITEQYEKVVLYILKTSGIIDDSILSLGDVPSNVKNQFNNYRILVEPVYAFRYNDNNFIFATPKAIAIMASKISSCSSGPCYGIFPNELYNNVKGINNDNTYDKFGSINVPEYISFVNENGQRWSALSNPDNGAGYAIIKLTYEDIPEIPVCTIEKNHDGNIVYYDDAGGAFANDISGVNLDYYISKCTCDVFDESSYKDEILNSSTIYQQKYNNFCYTPSNSCKYTKIGSKYTFYNKNGNTVSNFGEYVDSCGCDNSNVVYLKNNVSGFYSIHDAKCNYTENFIPNGKFEKCSEENNVSLTSVKSINEYCTRTCVEDITFKDVINTSDSRYLASSVKAGQYFELDKYPTLIEKKNCTFNFKYNDWENKYKAALKKMVDAYNNWKMYSSVTASAENCNSTPYGCSTRWTYYYNYNGFEINPDGLTLSQKRYSGVLETSSCGANKKNFRSSANSTSNLYNQESIEVSKLSGFINKCNNSIDFEGDNYYEPYYNLEFHYQQDILDNNSIIPTWNESRKINDSSLEVSSSTVSRKCNGISTSSKSCNFTSSHLYDTISNTNIVPNNSKITTSSLTREAIFIFSYIPKVNKYVTPLTGLIGSSGTYLGKGYDIDVKTISKNNNKNKFVFTSLGERPSDSNSLFKKIGASSLIRECEYETTNDLIECKNGVCNKGPDSTMNVVYRIVDPNNIDPNGRLDDGIDNGFKNWNNTNGKVVKTKMENTDIYNPSNLEYSFTLDSATIKDIREYNKAVSYSSIENTSKIECDSNGNECRSKFIEEAMKESPNLNGLITKKFAFNNSGSSSWKIITKEGTKCLLDGEWIKNVVCN